MARLGPLTWKHGSDAGGNRGRPPAAAGAQTGQVGALPRSGCSSSSSTSSCPSSAGARKSLNLLGDINFAYVIAGVAARGRRRWWPTASSPTPCCTTGARTRSRLLRINLSSLAVSHVVPGGTAPGTAVAFRLLTQSGVSGADAGFALAMQGVGSAARAELDPVVGAARVGVLPRLQPALRRGGRRRGRAHGPRSPAWCSPSPGAATAPSRSPALGRRTSRSSTATSWPIQAQRVAERLASSWPSPGPRDAPSVGGGLLAARRGLAVRVHRRAGQRSSRPSTSWSPTAWPRCWPSSRSRPRASASSRASSSPPWSASACPRSRAILGVLGYRLVNFWLPIPVGGIAYLSLRFSGEGWRQRLRHAPRRGRSSPRRRRGVRRPPTPLSAEG